ncbi:hypothetical protein [Undibacterium rugosum]|uniref:Peptidase S9A N-terminal domain-containing protein n=1 Tax=Undibacterium rugosum TaxID=2762291 RepID=A0A923I3W0_9BURK|nr:hypothetical protein [Undibacterium rugosum]MBC3935006.1 hypothetical protein [Undibacterium rugosum]MBR7778133.1 hypothetical protein [Undibacterium rugosum]
MNQTVFFAIRNQTQGQNKCLQWLVPALVVLALLAAPAWAQLAAWGSYPKLPVLNEIPAADPLAILEQRDDPQVQLWVRRQHAFSQQFLQRYPQLSDWQKTVGNTGMASEPETAALSTATGLIWTERGADRRARVLQKNRETGAERVLYVSAPEAGILQLSLSPDRSAIALQVRQSEQELAIVMQLDELKPEPELRIAPGSGLSWRADSRVLYYQPALGAVTELWQHQLGQPAQPDKALLRSGKAMQLRAHARLQLLIAEQADAVLLVSRNSQRQIMQLAVARRSEFDKNAARWQMLAGQPDLCKDLAIQGKDLLLIVDNKPGTKITVPASTAKQSEAPKQNAVYRLSLSAPQLSNAKLVFQDDKLDLQGLAIRGGTVFVLAYRDGAHQLLKLVGKAKAESVQLPFAGRVRQLSLGSDDEGILIDIEAADRQHAWYVAPDGKEFSPLLRPHPDGVKVQQRAAIHILPGQAGALTLLYPRGAEVDGKRPVLLMLAPEPARPERYTDGFQAWLEQDAIVATLVLPAAGKAHVADSLIAAAEYLVRASISTEGKIFLFAIGDADAALMQAALQRPVLFGAVALRNLRLDTAAPAKAKGRQAEASVTSDLDRWPFQSHLQQGLQHPPVLLLADKEKSEQSVVMTAKLAAALQLLSGSPQAPVLLTLSTDKAMDEHEWKANAWAFFLWKAGLPRFALAPR